MTLAHWRRFNCGVPTRDVDAAIAEAEWEEARTDEQIPVGGPIAIGLDVGWIHDATAIVPFYARDREHRLLGPAVVLRVQW